MDFDVSKTTRTCAASGREIAAGETYHSALVREGADVKRLDFAKEGWTGRPENAIADWVSVMPEREDSQKRKLAPSEVLLQLFHDLAEQPGQEDMRYVLTLMLIRRRLMRLEDTTTENGVETMTLYCARDEQTYQVPAVVPAAARVDEIQNYLTGLLFAPAG